MINYALVCADGHQFESWFKSASAFEALEKAGHLTCAICGNGTVKKAIMSPRVANSKEPAPGTDLATPRSQAEKAVAALRSHVEKNADYVGSRFAEEARSMHSGDAPERAIYGEANGAEAKALLDEGVPVAPLPFVPNRKAN